MMDTKKWYDQYYATRPVNKSWEQHKKEIYPTVKKTIHEFACVYPNVLEIGCGMGDMTAYLEKDFLITAIDLSSVGVVIAKEKVGKSNIYVMDALKLGFSSKLFDCVVMSEVLEHIKDQERALKEAYRVLKYGGVLIITTPYPKGKKSLSNQPNEYPIEPKALHDMLNDIGFIIKRMQDLVDGIYQMVVCIAHKPIK